MNLYIYLLFIKNCFILMKLNNLFNYFKNNSLSEWGLGIGDWGLGIGDWGLGATDGIPVSWTTAEGL